MWCRDWADLGRQQVLKASCMGNLRKSGYPRGLIGPISGLVTRAASMGIVQSCTTTQTVGRQKVTKSGVDLSGSKAAKCVVWTKTPGPSIPRLMFSHEDPLDRHSSNQKAEARKQGTKQKATSGNNDPFIRLWLIYTNHKTHLAAQESGLAYSINGIMIETNQHFLVGNAQRSPKGKPRPDKDKKNSPPMASPGQQDVKTVHHPKRHSYDALLFFHLCARS